VITKPREEGGVTKYHVSRQPVPLGLLAPVTFSEPARIRSSGLLRSRRGRATTPDSPLESANDTQTAYPFVLYFNGGLGGLQTLYAESAESREEWRQKLSVALQSRMTVK
jgi:RHO1 GDP-GTP exchange protein 1/2